VDILKIVMMVILVITSLFMVLLILLHKAKGGGLSDMFGGGIQSAMGASYVAEKNLNRITIAMSLLWVISVVLLGYIQKF
jgi:preprotein translocase subunit SecG